MKAETLGRLAAGGVGAFAAYKAIGVVDAPLDADVRHSPIALGAGAALATAGAVLLRDRKVVASALAGVAALTGGSAALAALTKPGSPAQDVEKGGPIARAINELADTDAGKEVGEFLQTGGVDIVVMSDAEFRAAHPGTGAVYQPADTTIYMPQSVLEDGDALVKILAHEGQHALDDKRGVRDDGVKATVRGIVSGTTRMVTAPGNPVSRIVDGIVGSRKETEVRAYTVEKEVADERGSRATGQIGEEADGEAAGGSEIRESLARHDLYEATPGERRDLSFKVTAGGIVLAAAGAGLLAWKAPGGAVLANNKKAVGAAILAAGAIALGHETITAPS